MQKTSARLKHIKQINIPDAKAIGGVETCKQKRNPDAKGVGEADEYEKLMVLVPQESVGLTHMKNEYSSYKKVAGLKHTKYLSLSLSLYIYIFLMQKESARLNNYQK